MSHQGEDETAILQKRVATAHPDWPRAHNSHPGACVSALTAAAARQNWNHAEMVVLKAHTKHGGRSHATTELTTHGKHGAPPVGRQAGARYGGPTRFVLTPCTA